MDIVEKKALEKYELGPTKCSTLKEEGCGVVAFLQSRKEARAQILGRLRALSEEDMTDELRKVKKFLEALDAHPERTRQANPCLEVGDLLVALESLEVPFFYTLNSAESQHLCRALGQTLIVRPADPLREDVVCDRDEPQWPRFGKKSAPPPQTDDGGSGC